MTANSWYWKKILEVRDLFYKQGALQHLRKGEPYSIAVGYRWLVGEQRKEIIYDLVWNSMNVPKNSFIMWLVMQGRIMTKCRAARFIHMENMDSVFVERKLK